MIKKRKEGREMIGGEEKWYDIESVGRASERIKRILQKEGI